MTGYHGTRYSNYAIQNADVILALGVRFGDRTTGPVSTFAQHARIIHVDIDPAEIGKNVPSDIPIQGDIKQILTQLLAAVSPGNHDQWHRRIERWKAEHPLTYNGGGDAVRTPYIIEELHRMAGDWIVVTDVGRHQIWASHYFRTAGPRRFITSGGLGTMGFGLPAAIGAAVGNPGKTVIHISGDGSFMMTCQQLIVASELDLPVVTLIMNDQCLGMIRQLQEVFYGGRVFSAALPGHVDFIQMATAMGVRGIRVERRDEVAPALKKALKGKGPCVVDFSVVADELVLPMVTGESLEELI
jgi:acetolactate synthase-1/2/3 large subunit